MTNTEVPSSESRRVLLVVTPDPEADSGEAERLADQLGVVLDALVERDIIESVTLLQSDEMPMPTGAKGGPVTLLVTLGAFGGVITVLLEDLSRWLGVSGLLIAAEPGAWCPAPHRRRAAAVR